MTAVTHGADPDALRLLAEEMLTLAEVTLGTGLRTQQRLAEVSWHGPDADRARQRWEVTELAHVRATSRALTEAAGHVLEQAREQEQASEATAAAPAPAVSAPAAPAAAPAAGTERSLGERARLLLDVLANGPELAQVAAVAAAGGRPALSMTRGQHELVSSLVGAARPGVGAVVGTARTLGSALNVYDTAAGLVRGDPVQATGGAGGLAAGALGPAVGAAWGVGWTAGGLAYEGMQGTRYGDAVERRNDEAFRTLGAFGMALVPGNLALGAWDVLTGGDEDPDGGGR